MDGAVERNVCKPIQLMRGGLSLSHLIYVDDIILFRKATHLKVQTVKSFLDSISLSSGEVINASKSKIWFSKNVLMQLRNVLSFESGFSITTDIGKYLGVLSSMAGKLSVIMVLLLRELRTRLAIGKLIILIWRDV